MLIKIRNNSLDIVKTSLTVFEQNYIEFMSIPNHLDRSESEHIITLTGEKGSLFDMLYYIARSCDIEIM